MFSNQVEKNTKLNKMPYNYQSPRYLCLPNCYYKNVLDRVWPSYQNAINDQRKLRSIMWKKKQRSNRIKKRKEQKQNSMKTLKKNNVLSEINSFEKIIEHKELIESMDKSIPQVKQLLSIMSPVEELCNMIGMKGAKKVLFNIVMGLLTQRIINNHSKAGANLVITGPPGVGKSTFLKVFSKLYGAVVESSEEKIVIATRSDLVGKYLGSSAQKTTEIVEKARGGI